MKDASKFGLNRKVKPKIEINPEVVKEQKKQKQSQITDFFRSHK